MDNVSPDKIFCRDTQEGKHQTLLLFDMEVVSME